MPNKHVAGNRRKLGPRNIESDSRSVTKGAMRTSALLIEGKSVLQRLRFIVQNKRPGTEEAVAATLALASRATLDFAFSAHAPETSTLAQEAALKQVNIPILKGRVPPVASCLNSLKTLHTFRPRPRQKEVSEGERCAIAMLDSDIGEFWRSVVSPTNNMPSIPASVRASLLRPDNRLNANAWAKALLEWREMRGLGFMLDSGGPLRDICIRMKRSGKRPGTNPVRAAFIKLAREHFVPLLKHEARRTDISSG